MDPLLIIVLALGLLLIAGAGYGYYARPAPVVVEPAPGPSRFISLLGIVGLILLVAFFTLWLSGWHFGFEAVPPR